LSRQFSEKTFSRSTAFDLLIFPRLAVLATFTKVGQKFTSDQQERPTAAKASGKIRS